MRRFLFLLLLGISVLTEAKTHYVHIEQWKTKNNIPVYFVENHALPIIDIATVFRAGSAYDQQHAGLAALTNQLIGQETKTLNTTEISNRIDELGIQFETNANRDMAVVHMRSMTEATYLKPAVQLYSTLLTQLHFSKKTFTRNQSQRISAIKSSLENPATLASIAFYKKLYGHHPYAHPVDGTALSVSTLTPKEVTQFYTDFYTKKNALIVMVGNISKEKAKDIANHLLEKLPMGQEKSLVKQPVAIEKKELVFPYQGTQSTIILGQIGVSRHNQYYFPLKVGNTILGDMGLTSLLMKTIRDQEGLVYDVSSHFNYWEDRGPFFIVLQTQNKNVAKAIQLAKQTLKNYVENGPTEAELTASKKYLNGAFPFSFSTNENILLNVVNIAFYHLPLNYLDTYQENINKITTQDIKKCFGEFIHPDKLTVVIAGHVKK